MIKLKQRYYIESWQLNDIKRMKSILSNHGYDATHEEIAVAYERFSEYFYSASWYSINELSDAWVLGALLTTLTSDD